MPYYGRRKYTSRRRRRTRKPVKSVARRSRYRKSARAQSRQIGTLARHLSSLKQHVKDETSMSAVYSQNFQSPLKTVGAANPHVIIPLTCGVSQKTTSPFQPITTLQLPQSYGTTLGWEPIFQPRELVPGTTDADRATVPPYIKLYKQKVKLRFWAGTITQATDITVSVLRVNTKGPVANIKSIASRLDGADHVGPSISNSNAQSYIQQDRDYASSDGVTFAAGLPGGPPQPPQPNPGGDSNLMWNKQLWTVEYQKQFTLGSSPNPQPPTGPSTVLEPDTPVPTLVPDNNQNSEECNFTINYGGLKLSAVPPPDTTLLALDPMAVTDMAYKNIPSEHKRFLVVTSSRPQVGASVFFPYMQYSSIISTRVPI